MVAAIALLGLGGWWLTRTPAPALEPAQPAAAAPAPKAVAPSPAPQEPDPGPGVPEQQGADTKSAEQAGRGGDTPSEDPTPEPARARRREDRAAARRAAAERPRARTEPAARITPREATEPPAESPAPAAEPVLKVKPSGPLPETPSRDAVVTALDAVAPAVRACTHGQRGIAQVDLTVTNAGKVSHAVVAGDFAGTPEGTCIARAVRGARFAPFQKPMFRVVYPFSL
jgi:hypothetical protein